MQRRTQSGLLLVVVIVGGLWVVDRFQTSAQQQAQYEYAIAVETSTAAKSDAAGGTMIARQLAKGATTTVKQRATADSAVATLQASLTAIAVGVHATGTAAAARH
jgi:cytoskeletal protein RodZ